MKSKAILVRINEDVHAKIIEKAKSEDRSLSSFIRTLLNKELRNG